MRSAYCLPYTALTTLYIFTYLWLNLFTTPCGRIAVIPTLQMKILRHKETKDVAPNHTTNDRADSRSDSGPMFLTHCIRLPLQNADEGNS